MFEHFHYSDSRTKFVQVNFANLFSSGIISRFLDYRGISTKKRITYRLVGYITCCTIQTNRPSFFYVIIVHIIAWMYGWVVQEQYTANPPVYDWSDRGLVKGLFVILLWRELYFPSLI